MVKIKPRLKRQHQSLRGWLWTCGRVGAKLYVGYGRTPAEAYEMWMKFHK